MSKAIKLSLSQWEDIKLKMTKDQTVSKSTLLIREKMKQRLGFTVREHSEWVHYKKPDGGYKELVHNIHLDFYSEPKRTMFLLRYSEIIDEKEKTFNR
jgi:hypothetical protein